MPRNDQKISNHCVGTRRQPPCIEKWEMTIACEPNNHQYDHQRTKGADEQAMP